jgi:tRNA (adenine22-N1)-methyltransferase
MVKLSKRLQTIADFVPEGSALADIGSDHALLPVYLAERGRVSFAIAGEIGDGPLEAAARQVKGAGISHMVSVRQGDGLAVVQPGEADVVTIAGMGGALIVRILEEGRSKLETASRLILQPNVAEDQVRRWLLLRGWVLADEALVEEDGKFYEILCAVRHREPELANGELYRPLPLAEGVAPLDRDELLRFGPHLVRSAEDVFYRKWEWEIGKLDKIAEGMSRGGTEAALLRREEMIRERNRIEEVLQCLRKGKR